MANYYRVALELSGVRWTGRWNMNGGIVEVCSAYGYAEGPVGRRKPERLAEELLLEILRAKLARLEERRKPEGFDPAPEH